MRGILCFEKLELSFSAKREKKSLWDAANHVQHAVWKWFLVPSAASLQLSCFTESKSAISAWKIQNRQPGRNSLWTPLSPSSLVCLSPCSSCPCPDLHCLFPPSFTLSNSFYPLKVWIMLFLPKTFWMFASSKRRKVIIRCDESSSDH